MVGAIDCDVSCALMSNPCDYGVKGSIPKPKLWESSIMGAGRWRGLTSLVAGFHNAYDMALLISPYIKNKPYT
ncbi:hypothetical protein H5410_042014 [Solanum commersonii]|uniref:Uncharacterized protein n=1 Tax=Solanum commersonii TaxID=4109 RepID=A0A9J5XWA5_SOLCO|nr:hypothetical protein H5410_042014 [Solanum commersonii]